MSFDFDAERAAQVLALFIKLSGKKSINRLKALKLMYIADRESIKESGLPITGDKTVAMKHGPVLSRVYDLMKTGIPIEEASAEEKFWSEHFRGQDYDLELMQDPGQDRLSRFAFRIIEEVYAKYGNLDKWALRDRTHQFPEWRNNDPGESSLPIPIREIWEALGFSSEKIDLLLRDCEEDQALARIMR